LNVFIFLKIYLPVKLLGQTHIGCAFALRTQVPPLKQYGIVLLHGLRRISQNLYKKFFIIYSKKKIINY
jgi:hypothetical protein